MGVLMELQDEMEFFVEGYKYHPKFRKGFWDGKIRLYSPYNKTVYGGLVNRILVWAQTYGYNVDLHPSLQTSEEYTPEQIAEFVNGLNLTRTTKEGDVVNIEPYTFQWLAIYHLINDRKQVYEASTAGGKSLILYMACRWHLAHTENPKILIVTDTTNLVAQLEENFTDYSIKSDWECQENVHKIYAGQSKEVDVPIYVSTWASMGRMPKSYFGQFTAVFVDECHKAKANTFKHILENSSADYKMGLTGTLGDSQVNRLVIEGLIGPVKVLLTSEQGRKMGITSKMKIEGVMFDYDEAEKKEFRKMSTVTAAERKAGLKDRSYPIEVKWLANHKIRNQRMCDFISHVKSNSVALFTLIEHGEKLYNILKKQNPDRNVYFIDGDVKVDDRENIRQIMKTETDAIIVASFGTFSTGVDIANLHTLFICSPVKSAIRLMQSLGRAGRLDADKDGATVYHFGDDLRVDKKKLNHTLRHFQSCFARYDKERLPYDIHRFTLT